MTSPRLNQFDVIVVGGGHAGTEAALAAARMGANTLLLTHAIETLGQMSCNPAIGGIGKGHLVKEIDALGGIMAQAADAAGIQFRILNASKGPAVRATRAQADRALYKAFIRNHLEQQTNLKIFQQAVDDILIVNNAVQGVLTQLGLRFYAPTVILTVGTFLAGKIHVGNSQHAGGRASEKPATTLAQKLREYMPRVGRLKTGTPPRIDGRTIDYSELARQDSDYPQPVFSFLGKVEDHPRQIPCYITHTNEKTHDIIREGLSRSPLYDGTIQSTGPRYCPSIEDKVVRFALKKSHQIFIEPEGLNTTEIYPNGISTSLPYDMQVAFVQSMQGFANAHITRPGYAIEYDFFDPRGLNPTLETKTINGLFFAGQINGTTGYEEAAAQGLIAGINAALKIQQKTEWYPKRSEAYIGVLIDDLVTNGTNEPYRMFTSRAEYRLLLREDNADLRLTQIGRDLNLVDDKRYAHFADKCEKLAREEKRLHQTVLHPHTPEAQNFAKRFGQTLTREYHISDLLRRPEVSYGELMDIPELGPGVDDPLVAIQLETQLKYQGYINRQTAEINRFLRHENTQIPPNFDYKSVKGLSAEVRQKLLAATPKTIGIASRISGVTPAAISLLLIHLKRFNTV